jgi:hypothetical protein
LSRKLAVSAVNLTTSLVSTGAIADSRRIRAHSSSIAAGVTSFGNSRAILSLHLRHESKVTRAAARRKACTRSPASFATLFVLSGGLIVIAIRVVALIVIVVGRDGFQQRAEQGFSQLDPPGWIILRRETFATGSTPPRWRCVGGDAGGGSHYQPPGAPAGTIFQRFGR